MRRPGVLAAIALAGALASCARVKPYQREVHARRSMRADGQRVERKLDSHVQEYREGSIGGAGVGGGGCGCN
jgi:hypothetical protein